MPLLSGPHRAAALTSAAQAPTALEAMFWSWMLGFVGARRLYLEELMITDFEEDGSGYEPDNCEGVTE